MEHRNRVHPITTTANADVKKADGDLIKTDADIVSNLTVLPQDLIFLFLSPGDVVNFARKDEASKTAVDTYFQQLSPTKKWQLGYTIFLAHNYSEIKLLSNDPSKNFIWKFMDLKLFHETEKNIERCKQVFKFGVSTDENAIRAMQYLREIMEIFPAPIEKLSVHYGALTGKTAVQALKVSEIEKVKILYFGGSKGKVSEAFDVLVDNITVSDCLDVFEFSGKKPLNSDKIAKIPYARLQLESPPAPEKIFEAASQKKHFRISTAPKSYCNSLIHCWLESKRCDMDVLSLEIISLTGWRCEGPLDKLFDGLNFVEGTRKCPHPHNVKPITEWDCLAELLGTEGIEIRREDGATLSIFYERLGEGGRFTLIADYPGRPIGDRKLIAFDNLWFGDSDYVFEGRDGDNGTDPSITAERLEKNKHRMVAAEVALHRYHLGKTFHECCLSSRFQSSLFYRNERRFESMHISKVEGRKKYGYFEVGKNRSFFCF